MRENKTVLSAFAPLFSFMALPVVTTYSSDDVINICKLPEDHKGACSALSESHYLI
jgi:hypothetical protein